MPHLRSIARKPSKLRGEPEFPFSVPVIRALDELLLDVPVTLLVGENGSGKSTLLEAIALAAGLPTVGSVGAHDDVTLESQRRLAKALRLVWGTWSHRGFFLRAEDFFGFTKALSRERAALRDRLEEIADEFRDASDYARGLAAGPVRASLGDMERRYGVNLDANSHGESFLKLFQSRFVPGGLFLLDEPEAPLSPQSQLALMAMMHDMVGQDSQFIVATHSPILLAYPGARIYSFDEGAIRKVQFDDLEHVRLTREFLREPERYLRHLFR